MMKICFSGAHRTGKTSLAERIAVDNDLIMYYTEVDKTFKKQTVKEVENLKGKFGFFERLSQQKIIEEHLTKCISQGENFSVFDRSFLDVYCYSEYFLSKHLKEFNSRKEEIRLFNRHLNSIRNNFSLIDFTFIVQPGIEFDDSEKSCSKHFQEELNEIFLNVADLHIPKHNYFVIPKQIIDFEERVELCQDILRKKFERFFI